MKENKSWLIDVPVAINFFARPDTFELAFSEIKKARPRQLFLIADGPRPGRKDDEENCKKCRVIAESVDWNCEVYHFYNEKNKGLFHTYFDAMTEVFKVVDRCIFLEDDVVVSQSFFAYCEELLERYKDDLRISMVTGINIMPGGQSKNIEADYFFSGEGSLTAYGLWKRTFDNMNMKWLENSYAVYAMKKAAKRIKPGYEKRIARYEKDLMWQGHIPHVEIYKNLLRLTQSQLCIVPQKNMVTNIGVCSNATHSANDIRKLPKASQCMFEASRYEIDIPLKHPEYVICDYEYENRVNYILAWNSPILKGIRRVEACIRHIIYGDTGRVCLKIKQLFSGAIKD